MITAIASFILALAWLPMLLKFLVHWRQRKNPLSFAIALTLAYVVYSSALQGWSLLARFEIDDLVEASVLTNVIVCGNFYLAEFVRAKNFPDQRRN